MATIEIYGPSRHSQIVDVPATIIAEASVLNTGGAWGYVRMRLTGGPYPFGFIEYGDIVGIRPGLSENVRATYSLTSRHEGETLVADARLEQVTAYGSAITQIGEDHPDFLIYIRSQTPYVPPTPPKPQPQPWPPWDEDD